ncbi:MAG: hypothetical protein OXI10_01745 [Gammaproteobacteria bacterium]|nr:hypothetical protein [Gammaproteobacteria bacterium]
MKQALPPVTKAKGVTPSERYLARLAEKSFLNLWSYPSPFRDQRNNIRGDGKEICDLLIVCDSHVIIFSEKTVSWPKGDLNLAWSRWAKRAIRDAARQSAGAERWIAAHPDRIFLDRACKELFPIDLPPEDGRIFHRIVVANGAAQPCRKNLSESFGSLIICPEIRGDAHWPRDSAQARPFYIGDIDPSGSFIHVFNEHSLDIVMRELDTITDFVEYLDKKANLVRSGRLVRADGEENLLAYYAIRINQNQEHDFVSDQSRFVVDNSHYSGFVNDAQYKAKRKADRISYIWDELITAFTSHMLDGTSVTFGEHDFQLKKYELGVRFMALEKRVFRRGYGEAVKGALEQGTEKEMFFRLIIKGEGSETAFFFLTFRYQGNSTESQEYEQYREARINVLQIYAKGILEKHPDLKRVIGISCEPPDQTHGSSEDMVYAEQISWTEEERNQIREECRKFGILRIDMTTRNWSDKEYPDV